MKKLVIFGLDVTLLDMVAVESVVPMVSLTPEKEMIAEERLLRLQASRENLPSTQRKKTGEQPFFSP